VRILVVDDNDDGREILRMVLTYAGAMVQAAGSAREAVELLEAADVVVTDYAMPGETGLWLLERVQQRPRPVPVIVVTGYADVYARELARAPFARVLRKPVDAGQLCRSILEVARAA
jgi:CheY-like chemotaxis protein